MICWCCLAQRLSQSHLTAYYVLMLSKPKTCLVHPGLQLSAAAPQVSFPRLFLRKQLRRRLDRQNCAALIWFVFQLTIRPFSALWFIWPACWPFPVVGEGGRPFSSWCCKFSWPFFAPVKQSDTSNSISCKFPGLVSLFSFFLLGLCELLEALCLNGAN